MNPPMAQPIHINVPPPAPLGGPIGQQDVPPPPPAPLGGPQVPPPPQGGPIGQPQGGPQGNIVINWNQPPPPVAPLEALPSSSEEEPEEPEFDTNQDVGEEPTIGIEGENLSGENLSPDETPVKKNPQIKYIDEDVLSKNLNLYLDLETPTVYQISFCIYNIQTDCFIEGLEEEGDSIQFHDTHYLYNYNQPFLQFALEKKESSYEFPSTTYECPRFSDRVNDDSEDEKSQEQIHFETFCFQAISTFLDSKNEMDVFHKDKIDIQGIYKGFLQKPSESPKKSETEGSLIPSTLLQESPKIENITVVFDFTRLIHLLKPQYTLAIIHELIYKRTLLSFPVNSSVTDFFETNDFMIPLYYVMNGTGQDETYGGGSEGEEETLEVLYPFQLYLCHYQDGEYTNVKKGDVWDYLPIEHELFNEIYAFTTEPILDMEEEKESYRRFSCFLVKEKYILKDVTELTDEEKESEKEDIFKASTLYYRENGLQVWGIKNITHFIEY